MIVNKYNKGGGGDMSQYWTSAQTESAITAATEGLASEEYVDEAISAVTSDAPTKVWVTGATESMIEDAIQTETARTENTYAKPADIPSLEGYATEAYVTAATSDMATKTWVGQQGYLTQHQSLAGLFADVEYVSSAKTINFYDQGNNLVGQVDATDFIKDGMVDTVQISGFSLVITFNTDAGKQDIVIALTDIFNPANYYTKAEVDAEITGATQGMATEAYVTAATANLATENYVDSAISAVTSDAPSKAWVTGDTETRIATAMAAETARTESTYAKPSQIPSLTGYATENYVDAAITAATENMVTTGDIADMVTTGDIQNFVTSGDVTSAITAATQGLATEAYVTAATQNMATHAEVTAATANLMTSAQTEAAITAATQGFITSAYTGFTTTEDFEEFAGQMEAKEEVIASAITELHDSIPDVSDFVTSGDIQDFVTSGDVATQITAATQNFMTEADVTAITSPIQTQLDDVERVTATAYTELHQDIVALSGATSGYATHAEVTAATQNMATQAYVTGITSPMQTAINNKVTNGGGISTIQKISQAGYDALVSGGTEDANTFYVITGTTGN